MNLAQETQRKIFDAIAKIDRAERELQAPKKWLADRVRTAEHNSDRGVSPLYLWQSGNGVYEVRGVVPAAGAGDKGLDRAVPTAKPDRSFAKGGGRTGGRQPKGRARRRARRAARARERADASARASLNEGTPSLKGLDPVPTHLSSVAIGREGVPDERDWDPPATLVERPRNNPWVGVVTVSTPAVAPVAPPVAAPRRAAPERAAGRGAEPQGPRTTTGTSPAVVHGVGPASASLTPGTAPRATADWSAPTHGAAKDRGAADARRPGVRRELRGPANGPSR
ncbi:hypothetical protein LO772_22230 [Yinghuangia sp. ASG 101]|uniref:hypothetical protein n=1 Tax=Yinghuangia sp. ASG 101 TaxID=2896848 RepID=UPI001E64002B|nr:hypothetical protein [Yinghuangia sp. ASG 101]UGQ09629.1 hypothetical protein LO772_22230 [Yinghuangia sp. ASG 101]